MMSKPIKKSFADQAKRLWFLYRHDSLFSRLIKTLAKSLVVVVVLDWFLTWSFVRAISVRTMDDNNLLLLVLSGQLFLFIIGAAAVTYFVRQALAIIDDLGVQLSQRSQDDLSPIEVADLPYELKPLATRTNLLLADLQEVLQAQRRFVYQASHQFRTPLTALRMESELMLSQDYDEEVRKRAERIHQISDRLIHLGQQLLVLAKADSGQHIKDSFIEVDLSQWALDVGSSWVPKMRKAGMALQFEGPSDGLPVMVKVDPMLLEELLSNLLDNALKYASNAKLVTISVMSQPPRLVLEDDGIGIKAGDEHVAFELFYRGNDNDASGSGLGLAIVQEIARAHGAELRLETRPQFEGTRFTIEFANSKKPH